MTSFKYKAINANGEMIYGRLDAANDSELEARLGRLKLDMISFREQKEQTSLLAKRRVSRRDLINFCFYLEQQHSAGVAILESLCDIRDSSDNLKLRAVLSAMIENIEGGKTLSQAMADYPAVFSPIFVSLIQAGEQSSRLGAVLTDLITSLKWQDELAAQTKKILMYPMFIGVFVIAVAVFMLTYLAPQIVRFLATTGNPIPWYTQALLSSSDILIHYWYMFIATPAGIALVFYVGMKKYPAFRTRVDQAKLHIPMVGPIMHKIMLSRFANYFALMYGADITILDALRICEKITGNQYIANHIQQITLFIEQGNTLTDSFASVGIFPNLVVRMIRVGESTGALDKALQNVSYFYNRDIEDSVGRLQVMIEPALILILAGFLCWLAVSILFPIYDMMGNL